MFGLKKFIRRVFDKRARRRLVTSDEKGLSLINRNGSEVTLASASFRLVKYVAGLFPIYKIGNDELKLSFTKDILNPITGIPEALKNRVDNYPKTFWLTIVKRITGRINSGIDSIKTNTIGNIVPSYNSFHEKFLVDLFKSSEIDFRKKLSEAIKTMAKEALTNSIQRHLWMFLIKIREEEQKRGHGNNHGSSSSGSIALPLGCRFVFKKDDASVFIIEQAPRVQTISYLKEKFRIALPYVIFIATIRKNNFLWLQMFFRTTRLQNEADELLCHALPNARTSDYTICFPTPVSKDATQAQIVEEAIQNYWGSNFNTDLSEFSKSAASQFPQLVSLAEWQKQSERNAQFVLGLKWQSTKNSVKSISEKMLNNALNASAVPKMENLYVDTLQEYAGTLGEKFSREIVEKIHFMVSHSVVNVDNLTMANEKLANLIGKVMQGLRSQVEDLLTNPSVDGELDTMCAEAKRILLREIDSICSERVEFVKDKIKQI